MKKIFHFIPILLIVLISCNHNTDEVYFTENGTVTIKGHINNPHDKTGMFINFDAVSGIENMEILRIDNSGNFTTTYNLLHPVFNCTIFDFGNINSPNLLIEPNTTYEVIIENNTLSLVGETGKVSNELDNFYNVLEKSLEKEIKHADTLYKSGIDYQKFISIQEKIEKDKINFYNSYCNNVSLSAKAKAIIESDIKFKTAQNTILYLKYGFDNLDVFTDEKLQTIINKYPITKKSDYYVRSCFSYISTIVDILSEIGNNEKLIEFVKSQNFYTPEELEVIGKLLNNDSLVRKSEEFKAFNTKENISKFRDLVISYPLNNIFNNIEIINSRMLKELVISQAVSKYYLKFNRNLNSSQWNFINNNISDTLILNYLHNKGNYIKDSEVSDNTMRNYPKIDSLFFKKYLGKVVYIDIFATWCGPCRAQFSFAKNLHKEFENKDIAFVNLCADSKKEDYENLLKNNKPDGENYFVESKDYKFLKEKFRIKGYPTYILLDKEGHIIDYDAPTPTSGKTIIDKIQTLL